MEYCSRGLSYGLVATHGSSDEKIDGFADRAVRLDGDDPGRLTHFVALIVLVARHADTLTQRPLGGARTRYRCPNVLLDA